MPSILTGETQQIIGRIKASSKDVKDEKVPTIPAEALICMELATTGSSYSFRLQKTLNIGDPKMNNTLEAMVGQGVISQLGTTNRIHDKGPPRKYYVFAKDIDFKIGSGDIPTLPWERIQACYPFVIMKKRIMIPMAVLLTSNPGTRGLQKYQIRQMLHQG